MSMVSIILVTYNSERYIKECIGSVFNQSYKNIEVIVIDNNSTDNTKTILKNYTKIKIIENKKNTGFAEANNQGYYILTKDGAIYTFGNAQFFGSIYDKGYPPVTLN